jgi:hypothetical protein
MGTRLVTIATFDQAAQARLAQNALREAGIQVAVSDEAIVAMDWLLSNAVGGIKVQVREEDAERAVTVLERDLGPGTDGEVDEEQLAAEAEAAAPEDEPEPPARPTPALAAPPEEVPPIAHGSRENYARRLFFAAWLGLVVPPVAFFALYLFLNAAFGEGELSPRGRYNLLVGGLVMAPWPLLAVIVTLSCLWP